jgi:hypothetical protein
MLEQMCQRFIDSIEKLTWKDVQQIIRVRGLAWLLTGLELCRKVGADLPEGSKVRTLIRIIGTADTIRQTLFPKTRSPVTEYANQQGLVIQNNSSFVYMFFKTNLHTLFSKSDIRVSEYLTITDVECELGRFAFVKSDWSDEYQSTYYAKPNIDMQKLLDGLWAEYYGRIFVAISLGKWQETQIDFTSFNELETPLYGNAAPTMDKLIARHKQCISRGVPRSYMFFGPPGTGKSSFANAFANKLGERILKLNAASLTHASIKDINFLLENLRPDFLIIDDVDKVVIGNALPTLLEILQKFKSVDTTIMMTVNSVSDLDAGLLRPGRIDTWVEFELPKYKERKEVLGSYAKAAGIIVSERDLNNIAKASNTMSQDYLREIIGELARSQSVKEVIDLTKTMKRLLGTADGADKDENETEEKEEVRRRKTKK